MQDTYIMIHDDDIPKCCGSCEHITLISNKILCTYDGDNVCIFGVCDNYEQNPVIFGLE